MRQRARGRQAFGRAPQGRLGLLRRTARQPLPRAGASAIVPKGAGGVFTFGVKGGYEAGVALVKKLQLFSHVANIGDTRSLVIHPASTTHRQLADAQKIAAGAGPDVVRLSIGLEDVADLIADLDQALG